MKQVFLPSGGSPVGLTRCLTPLLQAVAWCVTSSLPWEKEQKVGRIMPRMVSVGLQVSAWGKARQVGRGGGGDSPEMFSFLLSERTQE